MGGRQSRLRLVGALVLSLIAVVVAFAQGSTSCPEGCTFVCVIPDPGGCGCYGYCNCPPPSGTPVPTATPAHDPHYDVCYRYSYRCEWDCSDLAQGRLKTIFQYVDCQSGEVQYEYVEYAAPCGSCRRPRDCYQPGVCTPTPPRVTPTPPRVTPTPIPCSCPGPQEILSEPAYQMYQSPPYPIVVGQGGSGITVRIAVTIPDWTLRQWRQESRQVTVCVLGTPAPGQTACTTADGRAGHLEQVWRDGECVDCSGGPCRGVNGCGNQCWSPYCTSWDEHYPEYAVGGTIRLRLRQSSVDWIQTELATRYPGARVYQRDWQAPARAVGAYDLGNATLVVLESYFPVRDPGFYDVSAVISTTKRTLTYQPDWPVSAYLVDTSIIR